MNDLEQIRDALESAKTFLGQEILWKESNYVRGHGEKKYSELCVALSIIDRMIETPAPTEKVDEWSRAEKLKEDLWFLSNAYKFSESEKERVNRMNTCIDYLANTGRLR